MHDSCSLPIFKRKLKTFLLQSLAIAIAIARDCSILVVFLFMVALCNRADPLYFHPVSFFFLLSFSFLVVGDWMFTILWHMVWP